MKVGGTAGVLPQQPAGRRLEIVDIGNLSKESAVAWSKEYPSHMLKPFQLIYIQLNGGRSYAIMATDETGRL